MVEAFKTSGSSPPTRRYRLKLATWIVVREPGQPPAAETPDAEIASGENADGSLFSPAVV